ncbi:hypothetical protein D3C77_353660 [compost metagenome]
MQSRTVLTGQLQIIHHTEQFFTQPAVLTHGLKQSEHAIGQYKRLMLKIDGLKQALQQLEKRLRTLGGLHPVPGTGTLRQHLSARRVQPTVTYNIGIGCRHIQPACGDVPAIALHILAHALHRALIQRVPLQQNGTAQPLRKPVKRLRNVGDCIIAQIHHIQLLPAEQLGREL